MKYVYAALVAVGLIGGASMAEDWGGQVQLTHRDVHPFYAPTSQNHDEVGKERPQVYNSESDTGAYHPQVMHQQDENQRKRLASESDTGVEESPHHPYPSPY